MWERVKHYFKTFPFKMGLMDAIVITVVEVIAMLDIHFGGSILMFSAGPFPLTFALLPIMLLGGIFGYVDVAFAAFNIYIYYCFHDFQLAYTSIVYLIAGLMGFHFSRHGVFRRPKLFPACVITLCLLLGNGWYLLNCLLSPAGFSQVTAIGQFGLFLMILPEAMLFVLICTLFMKRAPQIWRDKAYCGYFYRPDYEDNKRGYRKVKKSRLGGNMMFGLVLDMVIVILGVLFISGTMLNLSANLRYTDDVHEDGGPSDEDLPRHDGGFLNNIETMYRYQEQGERTGELVPGTRFGAYDSIVAFGLELLMMLLCLTVPVILVTYFAFRKITIRPLENISEYVKGFAETADEERVGYTERVKMEKPPAEDEVWEIYRAVESMIGDISAYIENLRKESELENALQVAEEANRAKTSFLSNMSHEIRTPINSILGMNEMILRETREKATRIYANDIKTSSETLLRLINDILDLSRIEAGKLSIVPQQYDFQSTVNNLISIGDVQAEDKGLKFNIDVNPMIPSVLYGDEKRIVQCVMNIMSNAVKYTQEGRIDLSIDFAKENDDTIALRFAVSDTGIGIRPEDMERLFTPFDRIDDARFHYIEGTGLGLDIVKRLLAMMNSHLTVHSTYGEGSSFSFAIFQKVLQWEPIGDVKKRYDTSKDKPYKYQESFQAPAARILVIDDTNMNLVVIRGLLKQTRIGIDTADSGKDALKLVKEKKYQIIFIDHRMPGMDGIETHQKMLEMQDNRNKDVPCVALTANAVSGAREMYLEAGFQDYLAKPISVERLENMIVKYLPKEMVILPEDPGFEEVQIIDNEREDGGAADAFEGEDLSEFEELDGINLKMAMKNCDRPEILREALHEFLFTIRNHSADLEKYIEDGDIRNFTIAVHALKSNARLIGAMKLSSIAETCEEYGNAEDMEKIREKLPQLLSLYRSYEDKLEPIRQHRLPDKESLKYISDEDFLGALHDMRELIEAFDYDNAVSIMHMLEEYWIPENYFRKWMRVNELMAAVDLEGLLDELE